MTRERRWIVLDEDGCHVTLGRHSDPTEAEIGEAAEALRRSGTGGWLAVTEGVYYQPRDTISLMMVRELAPGSASWDEAVAAFQRRRWETLT